MARKIKLNLTAVLVPEIDRDNKPLGFTSYFAQVPNVIAQGDTREEALDNLFQLAKEAFEHEKENVPHTTGGSGSPGIDFSFTIEY